MIRGNLQIQAKKEPSNVCDIKKIISKPDKEITSHKEKKESTYRSRQVKQQSKTNL